ncbi:dGTP triphosphohydrolase [Gimesia maris]|uniref:dGTP triphosphohydrolase n=1 Tax=Gimesia maris TaxID=122 RepID=UPI0032EF17A6
MTHKLSWKKLLSSKRVPKPSDPLSNSQNERTEFEQDYDRILFSQPFRRLARKTQVHPMASNDHIHNRLTHSLEVASLGRTFANRAYDLAKNNSDLGEFSKNDFNLILQSACLIHDLGNPPFGHAGEEVVRAWIDVHKLEIFKKKIPNAPENEESNCRQDCLRFEGNAQGFRLAARSDNSIAGYLRLTYATLSSAIKYPWLSTDSIVSEKKKHSIYTSESDIFKNISEELGLVNNEGNFIRHPLSFLTEAADDICYRILDLEDAVEMGICDKDEIHDLFLKISKNDNNKSMVLAQLRGQAIEKLMNEFWKVFENDFETIMNGERIDDLRSSLESSTTEQLDKVKDLYESIFGHRKKVATELGAYHVLGRILNSLFKTIESIDNSSSYEEIHFLSKRCIDLTWRKDHVESNIDQNYYWWVHQVMDFISGMTDDYAIRLSGEIGGYSLGMK